MNKTTFDGKWTNLSEWKESAREMIQNDNDDGFLIRSAHQNENIYFLLNSISDFTPNNKSDFSILCIDSINEKNVIPDMNDYCILVTLGANHPILLQGGSISKPANNFQSINIPIGLKAIGTVSDSKDRYQKIPHPTYEFKIPTELIGRSNSYGFFVGVYDSNTKQFVTYPKNIQLESVIDIPSPDKWGNLVSPDNSLPEFHFIWFMVPLLFSIIFLQRFFLKINF